MESQRTEIGISNSTKLSWKQKGICPPESDWSLRKVESKGKVHRKERESNENEIDKNGHDN